MRTFYLILILVAALTTGCAKKSTSPLGSSAGSSGSGSGGSGGGGGGAATPTPLPTYVLWNNGSVPTTAANFVNITTLVVNTEPGCFATAVGSNLEIHNLPVSPTALVLTYENLPSVTLSVCPMADPAGSCHSAPYPVIGNYKLEFDIMLGDSPSVFSAIQVIWGQDTHCGFQKWISISEVSNLSFTHISLPLANFTYNCPFNIGTGTNIPFAINLYRATPGSSAVAMYLADIKWVP